MKPISNTGTKIVGLSAPKASAANMFSTIELQTLKFLERLSNSSTNVITDFLQKNTQRINIRAQGQELYRYKNLLFARTNGYSAYNLEQNVRDMQNSGITPQFVKYLQLGKDDFLTILKTDSEKLLPYTANSEKIAPQVKQNFKTNVRKLLERGIINREIFANKDALLVTQDGRKIIFADWSEITPISLDEQKNLTEMFTKWQI